MKESLPIIEGKRETRKGHCLNFTLKHEAKVIKLGKGEVIFNPGGRRIFDRGMNIFSIILWGYQTSKDNFYVYQTILLKDGGARNSFLCSRWGMKISIILWGYQTSKDNFYVYQTILLKDGGARNSFLCSRWGMKISIILWGYQTSKDNFDVYQTI